MRSLHDVLVIGFSILIALMLSIVPLPDWGKWFVPEWAAMVLIFWAMTTPRRIGVGVAWCVGLLVDVLDGLLLGETALAMTVTVYIAARFYKQIRVFPLLQQGLVVFLLILVYQLIIYLIQGMIGELPQTWTYWLPALLSMALWPWLCIVLRDYSKRFGLIKER